MQDETALTLLNKADRLWQPYQTGILALLEHTQYQPNQLSAVVNYASEHHLQLLNLMNQLTSNLQDKTHKEAEQIRIYQGIAFLLALANFFGISFMYNRCLHEVSRNSLMLHNIIDQVAVCVLIINADNLIIDSNHATQKLF